MSVHDYWQGVKLVRCGMRSPNIHHRAISGALLTCATFKLPFGLNFEKVPRNWGDFWSVGGEELEFKSLRDNLVF